MTGTKHTGAPLAAYAADSASGRGRRHLEPPPRHRSEYQRDRDRIIHSTAFRRLEYKTQVFVNHEGDLYRTRLTHSLEVAQIGRTVARALGLNEDLTEGICLAHDLGHTPFGHAGQDALNFCMREYGGFEHNLQSLRVVDELEEKYPAFLGLNLTFETREGILKHCARRNAHSLGDIGERFLQRRQPGLEAQLANIADEIAYNNHDVDDGLRSGLLCVEDFADVTLFSGHCAAVRDEYRDLGERRLIYETVRRMIGHVVNDLIENSARLIQDAGIASIDDARAAPEPVMTLSAEVREAHLGLKRFLRERFYKHDKVQLMTRRSREIVTQLFDAFLSEPALMPPGFRDRAEAATATTDVARAVADYIAGMTDRYATTEHERVARVGAGQ